MRALASCLVLSVFVLASPISAKQAVQTASAPVAVQRDSQAVVALQQAITAMGGNAPADSVATGTVIVIAGSETDQGTVRIETRGNSQTSEQIQTSQGTKAEVFSNGEANEIAASGTMIQSANRAATSQSRDFPLPFLSGLLTNADESLQFVGVEQNGASSVVHLRAANTYASQPRLRVLSEFTPIDIWLDAQTALPARIAWIQRDGGGASPRIRRETWFSNWQSFTGVLYPTGIQKFFNGTLWITIAIQSVSLNTGLTDADFPVEEVQP